MSYPVTFPTTQNQIEDYDDVYELYTEAVDYLMAFDWCSQIEHSDLYLDIGDKLCIFLFKINNLASKDDNFLWVIVGDLPPMYLDIHGAENTVDVLETYVDLADDWIDAVKNSKSVADCFPFQAQPTLQMAELLKKKTDFIQNVVIKNIDNIKLQI